MRRAARFCALVAALVCAHSGARAGSVAGVALDKYSYEPLAGVTVVATSPMSAATHAEITGDDGRYVIGSLPAGVYTVTFYYAEAMYKRANVAVGIDRSTYVFALLDTSQTWTCVCCWGWTAPILDISTTDQSVELEGDDLLRYPGSDSNPHGAAYYVDSFFYPTSAPTLPSFLLDESVELWGGHGARRGAQRRLLEVMTHRGSNELHGAVMARGEQGALELGSRLAGPLAKDRLWYSIATGGRMARGERRVPAVASLWYAHSPEHQGGITMVGDKQTDLAPGSAQPRTRRTGGATAEWVSKFDDNKLEVGAGVAYHRSDERTDTRRVFEDRVQTRATVTRRWRALGHHQSWAGLAGGGSRLIDTGKRFTATTRDAAAYAEDSWSPRANHTLNLGVRFDRQVVDYGGPAKIRDYRTASPRLGYIYDWTLEGRSKLYVHYCRYREPVSHDAPVPRVVDEVVGGVEYEVTERMPVGIAVHHASDETGVRVTWRRDSGTLRWRAMYSAARRDDPTGTATGVDHDIELDLLWELNTCLFEHVFVGTRLRLLDEQSSNLHVAKRVQMGDGSPLDLFVDVLDLWSDPTPRIGAEWQF